MSESIEQTIAALRRMTPAQLRQQIPERLRRGVAIGQQGLLVQADCLADPVASGRNAFRAGSPEGRGTGPRRRHPHDATSPPRSLLRVPTQLTLPAPSQLTAHDRLPIPGTVLTRKYRGRQIEVKVLPNAFEYDGQNYRSLTAVAKAITGSHWNGHLFFGLTTAQRKP